MKPKIFIGSSVEGLNVAYALQQNLTHDAESTVWDQGVFELSNTTIESLNQILDFVDFAIFVFSPDDVTVMRGAVSPSIRDNVLFELGLFIGKLGRKRVFYIVPDGTDVHIPTDLVGVTPGTYNPNREDNSYQAATGAVCNQIRNQIKKHGLLNSAYEDAAAGESAEGDEHVGYEWLHDFFDNEFESAKNKLEKTISSVSGDELLRNTAWLAYIRFKLDEKSGFQELCDLAETHQDQLAVQTLIPRFFLWEDYSEKAIDVINKALIRHPSASGLITLKAECYITNGEPEEAMDILNEASPSENPAIAIALAEIHEEHEALDAAIDIIHKAYITYPSNESLMYKYSRLLGEKNRHKESLFLLNALTVSHPNNFSYWSYLSNSCLMLNLHDKAMSACKEAEELSESKEAWILCNIGNLLLNKGFNTEAIDWLNKGLSLDASSQYGHDRLASAIKSKEKERSKFEDLCKGGRRLIRASPSNSQEEA